MKWGSGWIVAAAATVLAVSGCSFADRTLWPVLSGESGKPKASKVAAPAATGGPAAGTAEVSKERRPASPPRDRMAALAADVDALAAAMESHEDSLTKARQQRRKTEAAYDHSITIIRTRLRIGATRSDPALIARWTEADRHLKHIDTGISGLNALAGEVTASATLAEFLLRTARAAYELNPPGRPRHDALVRQENRIVGLDRRSARLLAEINREIDDQIAYMSRERATLRALALAVENGKARAAAAASIEPGLVRRPLVVIRFDRPKVAYSEPLYHAMKAALDKKPDAVFDLVAVSPAYASAAAAEKAASLSRRHATGVVRTLTDMGVPLKRLILSQTSSHTARFAEVHLYVR